jgi:hypothetical protein
MKQAIFGLVLGATLLPAVALAGTYGTAGCGLGALVFNDKPGKIQIVASTLNAIGVQTFGITTGTSECDKAAASASLDQELFLKTNRTYVMRDAAVGRGEYLATFATLLGCDVAVQPLFFETTQKNMADLFQDGSDREVLERVKQTVNQDPNLNAACVRI